MLRREERRDGGFIIVLLAAGLLLVICLVAGLAIDGGRAYALKSEVQNAADAAARAGATMLYPASSTIPLSQVTPDFTAAASRAREFVKKNLVGGDELTDADIVSVEAGYWNVKQNPAGIQPPSITPHFACSSSGNSCTPGTVTTACSATEACLQQDVPAVRVSVQKREVSTYFAKLKGWKSFSPGATAVAGRGYPKSGEIGFPFAVTKCMVDYYIANGLYGQIVTIPGSYGIPNCNTGNWSSLNIGGNANSSIQGLLNGSLRPQPVTVGQQIEIQPGARANLYGDAQQFIGQTVFIPIVADNLASANSSSAVTGFITFKVTSVTRGGPDLSINGEFVRYSEEDRASGYGGSQGNTVSAATLIK